MWCLLQEVMMMMMASQMRREMEREATAEGRAWSGLGTHPPCRSTGVMPSMPGQYMAAGATRKGTALPPH